MKVKSQEFSELDIGGRETCKSQKKNVPAGGECPAAAVGALYLRHHLEGGEPGVGHHGEPEHVHVPRHRDGGRVLCSQLGHGVGA